MGEEEERERQKETEEERKTGTDNSRDRKGGSQVGSLLLQNLFSYYRMCVLTIVPCTHAGLCRRDAASRI